MEPKKYLEGLTARSEGFLGPLNDVGVIKGERWQVIEGRRVAYSDPASLG